MLSALINVFLWMFWSIYSTKNIKIISNIKTKISHREVPVCRRFAESCEEFGEPLQTRLATGDVTDDEPEQSDHLQDGSYGGEDGAL